MVSELREPSYLVLTALAGQPLHGYGIIKEVLSLTGGRVKLRAGSLYGTLDRLVDEGLICASGEEIVDGRLRRYYSLTDTGASALAAHATSMVVVSNEALRRLQVAPRFA
jgi:PadR family transcriptional regulator, regulatory protein PadR